MAAWKGSTVTTAGGSVIRVHQLLLESIKTGRRLFQMVSGTPLPCSMLFFHSLLFAHDPA